MALAQSMFFSPLMPSTGTGTPSSVGRLPLAPAYKDRLEVLLVPRVFHFPSLTLEPLTDTEQQQMTSFFKKAFKFAT
jgi:hypothetical protein